MIVQLLSLFLALSNHLAASSIQPAGYMQAECTIANLQTTSEAMSGQYLVSGGKITFSANHDVNEGVISSVVTFQDTTALESPAVTSTLSFPFTNDRMITRMNELIIDAAMQVNEESECNLPESLNQFYEEFADSLFNCTTHMGGSQLRFSVMYHEAIIGSARRICNGAQTICTPAPDYDLGDQMFMCGEDMVELFPDLTQQAKIRMAKINEDKTSNIENESAGPIGPDTRGKRGLFQTLLGLVACPFGFSGSSWCCCGNYDGCCYFADTLCCVHDAVCTCCSYWYCGPDCQPDSWCD